MAVAANREVSVDCRRRRISRASLSSSRRWSRSATRSATLCSLAIKSAIGPATATTKERISAGSKALIVIIILSTSAPSRPRAFRAVSLRGQVPQPDHRADRMGVVLPHPPARRAAHYWRSGGQTTSRALRTRYGGARTFKRASPARLTPRAPFGVPSARLPAFAPEALRRVHRSSLSLSREPRCKASRSVRTSSRWP